MTRNNPNQDMKTGQDANPVLQAADGPWEAGSLPDEVALTIVLLVGASLFVRTLWRSCRRMPASIGTTSSSSLRTPVAAGYKERASVDVLRRPSETGLSRVPGVRVGEPLSCIHRSRSTMRQWTQPIAIDGAAVTPEKRDQSVHFNAVSPGYFATLGIRLVAGRDFERRDDGRCGASRDRERVAGAQILRRTAGALGRRITMGAERRDERAISRSSGIVADARSTSGCRKRRGALPICLRRKRVSSRRLPLVAGGEVEQAEFSRSRGRSCRRSG